MCRIQKWRSARVAGSALPGRFVPVEAAVGQADPVRPAGSESTGGFEQPDQGDGQRLWNTEVGDESLLGHGGCGSGTACALKFNPVVRYAGHPYIHYWNHKMRREAFVRIEQALLTAIFRQQQRVADRHPDQHAALLAAPAPPQAARTCVLKPSPDSQRRVRACGPPSLHGAQRDGGGHPGRADSPIGLSQAEADAGLQHGSRRRPPRVQLVAGEQRERPAVVRVGVG